MNAKGYLYQVVHMVDDLILNYDKWDDGTISQDQAQLIRDSIRLSYEVRLVHGEDIAAKVDEHRRRIETIKL